MFNFIIFFFSFFVNCFAWNISIQFSCQIFRCSFFFLVINSPQASSYASQWPWTKVTATGEWHPANGRKDSSSTAMSPSSSVTTTYLPGSSSSSTSNEFQRFQQQLMAVNSSLMAGTTATAVASSNSAGARNQRMSSSSMGLGNVNANNNGAANRNSVGGGVGVDVASKAFDAYPFLPPPPSQPLNAQNPLSPTHSPMRQQQQSPMSNQSMAQQQQHSPRSAFSLDRIAGQTLQSNLNQKSNQSNSTDQSSSQQQQQQSQHNPMLSPTRHLPFPYSNLNNYHRNF